MGIKLGPKGDVLMGSMRELELKGRSTRDTKQYVHALAWATNRRGRITWKDDVNVTVKLREYLLDHNVYLPISGTGSERNQQTHRLRYAMNRLVDEKLAHVKLSPAGEVIEFGFEEDVNITGFTPIMRHETEQLFKPHGRAPSDLGVSVVGGLPILPPLPIIKTPRFLAEDITSLLDVWAEHDPDAYADWAEKLVTTLRALTVG